MSDDTIDLILKSHNVAIDPSGQIAQQLPTQFRLFKVGTNTSITNGDVIFDEQAAQSTWDFYLAHGQARLAIDYEHMSTAKERRAGDGRAAGWFTPSILNGELWATQIEWTKEGKERLINKEYAYYSPTFYTNRDNRVVGLVCVALTNNPATDNLTPIIEAQMQIEDNNTISNESVVDNAESVEHVNEQNELKQYEMKISEYEIKLSTYEAQIKEYAQQVIELKAKICEYEQTEKDNKINGLIESAINEGKASQAMRATLTDIGNASLTLLEKHIEALPKIAALSAQKIEQKAAAKKSNAWDKMSIDERVHYFSQNKEEFENYLADKKDSQ